MGVGWRRVEINGHNDDDDKNGVHGDKGLRKMHGGSKFSLDGKGEGDGEAS